MFIYKRSNLSSFLLAVCLIIAATTTSTVTSFAPSTLTTTTTTTAATTTTTLNLARKPKTPEEIARGAEIIGKRIILKGDVNGGYVRTCIQNEASRFRRLIGTMSPPEDSDTAEIYVEGKRKNVEGFMRWCNKGTAKVGLSQKMEIVSETDETPTGLYDDFYVKTK
jgi:acylphosphatase